MTPVPPGDSNFGFELLFLHPIVAFDLRITLEQAGATVIGPALTVQQAETLSCEEHISVALMDVRLGDRDVFNVAAKLWDRGVPMVFHTGHGAAQALLARWPGSKVLTKPTRSDVLLSTIAGLFRKFGSLAPSPLPSTSSSSSP